MSNQATANISHNKNRLRSYGENVYLKDGENFEIELFNGFTTQVMAKIWINGELISTSGLVLKPGQRYFLERFIDDNAKLKFETYDVDGTTEAQAAIKQNGLVKVEFYKKSPKLPLISNILPRVSGHTVITGTPWWQPMDRFYYTNQSVPCGMPLNNNFYCANTGTDASQNVSFTSTSNVTMDFLPMDSEKSVETGRVEMGEASNQYFGTSDETFESYASCTSTWNILPESSRPIEVSQIRNYCSGCGSRIRKQNWSFCPTCGNVLD
jgi:hypothetical protein